MVAGLYALIPGLKEAEDDYRNTLAEAFVGVEPLLAGRIKVKPFTPQMFLELDGCENRFFASDLEPQHEDIAAFLWRVSPLYQREDSQGRKDFAVGLYLVFQQTPPDVVAGDIYRYIARAWAGMPLFKSAHSNGDSVTTWASHLVHMIAKEYGWTEEYILNMPFRRLWQYVNRIMEDLNPKYREKCARALQLRQDWLIAQNSK